MIKGASLYLAGAVKKSTYAMEDYGYCMEAAILKAAELGISTCWLGGTFSRSNFAKLINLAADEVIPAVTPLGYPGDKSTLLAGLLGMARGNRSRKAFEELFFDSDFNTPLDAGGLDAKYRAALESVRLAPSASNKQPWRIIRDEDKKTWHFYLNEDKLYNNVIKDIKLQNVDMGISICHFDMTVKELGLNGSWKAMKPGQSSGRLEYITSWSVDI
jgi:nitroreductase